MNPAFIVDGFTEQRILAQLCPGMPVKRANCNGNKVSLQSMAQRISTLIRLMNNRHYPIFILIDKEDRTDSVHSIIAELRREIYGCSHGINHMDIRIGVCDQMIENWIVADWDNFCLNTGTNIPMPVNSFDGVDGENIIRRHYPNYQKTTDGVNFFY